MGEASPEENTTKNLCIYSPALSTWCCSRGWRHNSEQKSPKSLSSLSLHSRVSVTMLCSGDCRFFSRIRAKSSIAIRDNGEEVCMG